MFMSDKFTNIEVEEITGKISNDEATSVGVGISEEVNNLIPTDKYNIVRVLEDTLLCEYVDDKRDEQGFTESEGGILIKEDEGSDKHLFEVVRVILTGKDTKEVKVGDIVVVSKSSGLRMMEFDGRETLMIREAGVFMIVESK